MFDVGFSELLLLAIIALVVLGPEKLPHAARMAGAWMGRIRRTLINVQADIENEVASAEMRERIRKEMAKAEAAKQQLSADITANLSTEQVSDSSTQDGTPKGSDASSSDTPASSKAND